MLVDRVAVGDGFAGGRISGRLLACVRMMAGASGGVEGENGTGATGEGGVRKGKWQNWILFGNFVFLGLRSHSGIRQQGEVDLYLYGEGGRRYLTDYNCGFVAQSRTLCSAKLLLVYRSCRPSAVCSFVFWDCGVIPE